MSNITGKYRKDLKQFISTVMESERVLFLYNVMLNLDIAGLQDNDVILQGYKFALALASEINVDTYMSYFPQTAVIQAASFLLRKTRAIEKEEVESIRQDMINRSKEDSNDG